MSTMFFYKYSYHKNIIVFKTKQYKCMCKILSNLVLKNDTFIVFKTIYILFLKRNIKLL